MAKGEYLMMCPDIWNSFWKQEDDLEESKTGGLEKTGTHVTQIRDLSIQVEEQLVR